MSNSFLAITRHTGERILIGNDIVIRISRVRGPRSVQIVIECPRDIPVRRPSKAEDAADRVLAQFRQSNCKGADFVQPVCFGSKDGE